MRTTSFGFIALLVIGVVAATDGPKEEMDSLRLPVRQPEHIIDDKRPDNAKDLLSTLQELHHSLIAQIAALEVTMKTSSESSDQSEMTHLLQHYTAQKNNIEREIALIQSIQASPTESTAPRHISKYVSSAEEKSVSSLFNIFRKNKNPNNVDEPYNDIGYSLPYPPYYVSGYGPYPYPYSGPPPKPHYPHPEDLIESTFPGYPRPPTTFVRGQPPSNYQAPMEPHLTVPSQYPQQPQVVIQPDVQPSQRLQNPQSKPDVEPPFRPPQPQLNQQEHISEEDIQKNQESPSHYGQKQGVFIYYPNAVITQNEEQERPTIADRFGQAIDRFGQAISNLANRQPPRNPVFGSDVTASQKSENSLSRTRIRNSRPRSSSNQSVKDKKEMTIEDKAPKVLSEEKMMSKNPENKKLKLRWVSA